MSADPERCWCGQVADVPHEIWHSLLAEARAKRLTAGRCSCGVATPHGCVHYCMNAPGGSTTDVTAEQQMWCPVHKTEDDCPPVVIDVPGVTGATCGLCGERIEPDFPVRPDTYVHRATGDEDCTR